MISLDNRQKTPFLDSLNFQISRRHYHHGHCPAFLPAHHGPTARDFREAAAAQVRITKKILVIFNSSEILMRKSCFVVVVFFMSEKIHNSTFRVTISVDRTLFFQMT